MHDNLLHQIFAIMGECMSLHVHNTYMSMCMQLKARGKNICHILCEDLIQNKSMDARRIYYDHFTSLLEKEPDKIAQFRGEVKSKGPSFRDLSTIQHGINPNSPSSCQTGRVKQSVKGPNLASYLVLENLTISWLKHCYLQMSMKMKSRKKWVLLRCKFNFCQRTREEMNFDT